jgi:hypothetical protein
MIGASETPTARAAETLEQVTLAVGLTLEDLVTLLMAGVKVTDLFTYAEAVTSNRLN